MITLSQLLESRDRRASHQKDLLGNFPGRSLLCLTVLYPGPVKRNVTTLAVARAGVDAVRKAFEVEYEELLDLDTGYEGYFIVKLPFNDAKLLCCNIEDNHPLGRLMDMDVITPEGPLSREKERQCLLCGRPARYCMRAGTHTTEELISKIESIVAENL